MSTPTYDAIVIGLGGMGSAAAYHLARGGGRVLGLDAHPRGHKRGSSHGHTRIIREAYFEAPEYVPLVRRAYELWRELEAESGRRLLTISGGLNIGAPESELIDGVRRSTAIYGIEAEDLTPDEVARRFPGFRLTEDLVAVHEPGAGFLAPEECVGAHLDLAAAAGAEIHHPEPVLRWSADGDGVRVETATGAYSADRLVIAPGPWAGQVLAELGLPLEVWRVVNVHFQPSRPELFKLERCPVHLWEVPEGVYYGFPALPGQGMKCGRHDAGEVCTPDTIRREVDAREVEGLRRVFERYMPGSMGEMLATLTCMYTNTPDQHFVIDVHPEHPQVVYACGFSGHGFKFSSVVGEVLAGLAMEGATRHPIEFLSASRLTTAAR